jgi:hypothetical protein
MPECLAGDLEKFGANLSECTRVGRMVRSGQNARVPGWGLRKLSTCNQNSQELSRPH